MHPQTPPNLELELVLDNNADEAITLRLPAEARNEFILFWKELRLSDGLPPEDDLKEPEVVERFDGGGLVEWIIPRSKKIIAVLIAALGLLAAKRGEFEYRKGKEVWKFRNMTPKQIMEIREIFK